MRGELAGGGVIDSTSEVGKPAWFGRRVGMLPRTGAFSCTSKVRVNGEHRVVYN